MANYIRYATLFRFFEVIQPYLKYSLPLEEELPGERALVVAPHQDDEAIGCGGAILRHTRSGKTAEVLFCTRESEERDREAREAAGILGFRDVTTLPHALRSLKGQKDLPDALTHILETRRPDILLIPFCLDNHTDHRAVNQALIRVAGKTTFRFMVYAFPIWFPLHPNVLIDIDPVREGKAQAIRCYRSQMADRDYVAMSHGLGTYWAKIKGRQTGYVESYFRATFGEYTSLARKIFG